VLAVTYIGTTSLQLRAPSGSVVPSGGSIPAGTYQLQVDDADYTTPKFQISGPGVNIAGDNLDSSGMGIDRPAFLGSFTFQPNASYRIQDANIGASSVVTFTTTAGGGTSGGTSSGGTSSGGSSSSGGGSSGGTSSGGTGSSSSGSTSSTKMVGTLKASVSAAGKPALTFGGKAVKTLKAGRYMVTVTDKSKKAGFIVWPLGKHAMTISGSAAIGSSSHTVTFGTGKWFFEASTSGPKTYFSVTG
jgi:hypothetical protein